jgi:hypothetical protein
LGECFELKIVFRVFGLMYWSKVTDYTYIGYPGRATGWEEIAGVDLKKTTKELAST